MARLKLVVDSGSLEQAVNTVEVNGALGNRSLLYKAVEKEYNRVNPNAPITSSVVCLRLAEFGIKMVTPVGKRGRPAKLKTTEINEVPTVTQTETATVPESNSASNVTWIAPEVKEEETIAVVIQEQNADAEAEAKEMAAEELASQVA